MTTINNKQHLPVVPLRKMPINPFSGRLKVSVSEGVYMLKYADIIRIQASGNYCVIHHKQGGPITASKTLKYYEGQLPSGLFIRLHSSHLVSMDEILFISKTEVTLLDGTKCPISRRMKSYLNQLVNLNA